MKLTSCSLTPRSGRQFVYSLASDHDVDVTESLYNEAKLALSTGDLETAHVLFRQCPYGHRNTASYLQQCTTYKELCTSGVLQRETTSDMRRLLAEILLVDDGSVIVSKYSELLVEHGYTEASFRSLTLWEAEDFLSLSVIPHAHRARLDSFFASNTGNAAKVVIYTYRAAHKCISIGECIKFYKLITKRKGKSDQETAE